MRKHRPQKPDSNRPPASRNRSALDNTQPLPWPTPPTRLSLSSPNPPRDRSDGPRSLPISRLIHRWNAHPDSPSYSSLARLAGRDDTDNVVASVSLPPTVEAEGIHEAHHPRPHHPRIPSSNRYQSSTPDVPSLTRSDSLLNRARRVFSLPSTFKKRSTLVDSEKRERRRLQKKPPGPNIAEAGSLSPAAAAAARNDDVPLELEARVHWLEDQLEAARVRNARQRRRIAHLEEMVERERQSRPAVETLIQSALRHFEAKEAALKHTIETMDRDYAAVLAEKNEAMRLLTAFVGRGGRSPPASFSSVSEAGTDSSNYKASRRALSMDTFRRTVPPNSGGGRSQSGGFEFEHVGERSHE